MKLGLHIHDFSWPGGASQIGPTLARIAQAADVGDLTASAWGTTCGNPSI
jgi:hypothetical protein